MATYRRSLLLSAAVRSCAGDHRRTLLANHKCHRGERGERRRRQGRRVAEFESNSE